MSHDNQDPKAPKAPQAPQAPQADELVPIESVDQMANYMAAWFVQRREQITKLLSAPAGTSFEIGEGAEATVIELSGDTLKGFKFGVEMALMQLGELPFGAILEDAPTGEDQGNKLDLEGDAPTDQPHTTH